MCILYIFKCLITKFISMYDYDLAFYSFLLYKLFSDDFEKKNSQKLKPIF